MSEIDEFRAAMRQAVPSGRGNYVEEGTHTLQIVRVLYKRTVINAKAKESYIAELKIVHSTNPTHEVGSQRSYIENPDNLGYDGRFKAFMIAACGLDPSVKLSAENNEAMVDFLAALRFDEYRAQKGYPENWLAGRMVVCAGSKGQSRSGSPVTNKIWTPYVAPAAAPAT